MSLTLRDLPINPFENSIVMEPREAEPAIESLNGRTLNHLLEQFSRLESQPLPRLQRLDPPLLAQLVTSAEPGYGKSHLLGRLFRAVDKKATRVCLRPFADPLTSWRSILQKVVSELQRPDDSRCVAGSPSSTTQLEAIAYGVLTHLLISQIKEGTIQTDDPELWAEEVKFDSKFALDYGKLNLGIINWIRTNFHPHLLKPFRAKLTKHIPDLFTPHSAWLKVLYAYLTSDAATQSACLQWILGEGLDNEDADAIGLTTHEIQDFAESPVARNERSYQHLFDLLKLSSFSRPFLFSFDQTENFISYSEACGEFGRVITELVENGCNVFLVITANDVPWNELSSFIEKAHLDRIAPPLALDGINQKQAVELIQSRLRRHQVAESEIQLMTQNPWIADHFRHRPTDSVRSFLRACAQHFNKLLDLPPLPPDTLETEFQVALNRARTEPGHLDFDAGVLTWFTSTECIGSSLNGWEAGPKLFLDKRNPFSTAWQRQHEIMLWGVEESNHWQRWVHLLETCENYRKREQRKGHTLSVILLRLYQQKTIPPTTWTKIGPRLEAARSWFRIRVLNQKEWETIVAAHTLWSSAEAGDIPFSPAEVLDFLREILSPLWKQILDATSAFNPDEGAPPCLDLEKIAEIIRRRRFLSLDQLREELKQHSPNPPDGQALLKVCKQLPQVTFFSTAQTTALQWNPSSSPSPN